MIFIKIIKKNIVQILQKINGKAHIIFANIDKAKYIGWEPEKQLKTKLKIQLITY